MEMSKRRTSLCVSCSLITVCTVCKVSMFVHINLGCKIPLGGSKYLWVMRQSRNNIGANALGKMSHLLLSKSFKE